MTLGKTMRLLGILFALLATYVGRFVGSRYGWGYHVALLVVLIGSIGLLVRLGIGKDSERISAPPASTPEEEVLEEEIAALEADVAQLRRKMRIDAFIFPALLFSPTIVTLIVLGQEGYRREHRGWGWIGLVAGLVYVVVRYAFARKEKA
jgi:hypothetical protein